jgi:hypothetical protein
MKIEYIIEQSLQRILAEAPTPRVTDNAPSDSPESPFTQLKRNFLVSLMQMGLNI